ncbi:Phosphatidylinositol transfer protein SEC14 and related proteins protein [Dioscorea alata]|uniref:Phosphatidylinositol transfer protein SEC14 and related proteins protein n=1 Tax=Dioscorea alata TaxID=55571 RepID=A0ACB7U060_DIOAL|nr:Phosphatidylinositol transfer protein SEC14 and related proteins protein [Dioscorea alata]
MDSGADDASKEVSALDEEEGTDEWKKVALMRAFVEKQDSAAKEEDDYMLRRFLRARELDLDKASNLFLKYLKWKKENIPKGFISESEVQNEISHKKMFMQGLDKKGRPIGVALAVKHYSSKRDLEEFKRFVVYILGKLCDRMPRGQEKFTVIGDLQGWGYSNCDIRAYLAALDILQNNYPERLGKVYLVHVPYLFMKAYKIIYPFIDKRTREKIVFVEDKNLKETLLEDIDEDQLPEIYGGKAPLVPIEESLTAE